MPYGLYWNGWAIALVEREMGGWVHTCGRGFRISGGVREHLWAVMASQHRTTLEYFQTQKGGKFNARPTYLPHPVNLTETPFGKTREHRYNHGVKLEGNARGVTADPLALFPPSIPRFQLSFHPCFTHSLPSFILPLNFARRFGEALCKLPTVKM